MLQLDRPGAVCTVAVSLVAAVAALLPATARADDPLSSVATVMPLADTAPVATDAIASSAPELAPLVERDEHRHIAFGVRLLRDACEKEPR